MGQINEGVGQDGDLVAPVHANAQPTPQRAFADEYLTSLMWYLCNKKGHIPQYFAKDPQGCSLAITRHLASWKQGSHKTPLQMHRINDREAEGCDSMYDGSE